MQVNGLHLSEMISRIWSPPPVLPSTAAHPLLVRPKLGTVRRCDDHRLMQERRQARSELPTEALGLLLEAHLARLQARTLVVTTPTGDLLGGAGHDPVDLAASIVEELHDGTETSVATWRLRVGDRDLVIGSLGGRLCHEVGDGVRRIFAAL